jgi:hypothetical protein
LIAVVLLAVGDACAAPVPIDTLDEILQDVHAKHQATFLVGGTWDTMKAVEKVLAETAVPADLRRVADDLSIASTWLTDQVSSGAYQCALYVGKSGTLNYSVHRFGDCDHPPTAGFVAPASSAKGTLTPDPARTGPMYVAAIAGAPDVLGVGPIDPAAARSRLQSALADHKWPTAEPARYAASGVVRELSCTGERPSCRAAVAWTVTDGDRKAPVYQVVTRGGGTAGSASDAASAALEEALLSLLSRPLLVSRLDPSPPVTGDPAPDWTGEVQVRACPVAGPVLPGEEADLRARIGTASRDPDTAAAVLISPDGWVLAPSALALAGPVHVTAGTHTGDAVVVRTDKSLGIALLRAPGDDWPCVPLGASAPSAGAKLYAPLAGSLASCSVIGVQSAGSLKFVKTNLAPPPTATPLLDATGQVRALASSAVSIGGVGGAAVGLPAPTLLDRLDILLGPTSEPDAAQRAGTRGTAAVLPTIDVDDPEP